MTDLTPEQFYAQIQGTLEAVVCVVSTLIAVHPEKAKLVKMINSLWTQATETESDNEETKSKKLGIRRALVSFVKALETAQLADEIRSLKNETGSH